MAMLTRTFRSWKCCRYLNLVAPLAVVVGCLAFFAWWQPTTVVVAPPPPSVPPSSSTGGGGGATIGIAIAAVVAGLIVLTVVWMRWRVSNKTSNHHDLGPAAGMTMSMTTTGTAHKLAVIVNSSGERTNGAVVAM